MDKQQYEELAKAPGKAPETISISEIMLWEPRTLLWGYTPERYSHHVYIAGKPGYEELHCWVYMGRDHPQTVSYQSGTLQLKDIVPTKRLYPEACDYRFCEQLKGLGLYLPFTTFNEKREHRQYHGQVK